MSNLILQASILGTKAFQDGKKAIPCLDKDLLNLLEEGPKLTLELLKAWSENWHLSNINQ